ncbi:MAG: hypothetical protein ACE366_00595 [Bradymonadia bacterium]
MTHPNIPVHARLDHDAHLWDAAVTDEGHIITSDNTNHVSLWVEGELRWRTEVGWPKHVAVSGEWVVVGVRRGGPTGEDAIKLLDLQTGVLTHTISLPTRALEIMGTSADGRWAVTGATGMSGDRTPVVTDLEARAVIGKSLKASKKHWVQGIDLSPTGALLATASGGEIKARLLKGRKALMAMHGDNHVACLDDERVLIWDARSSAGHQWRGLTLWQMGVSAPLWHREGPFAGHIVSLTRVGEHVVVATTKDNQGCITLIRGEDGAEQGVWSCPEPFKFPKVKASPGGALISMSAHQDTPAVITISLDRLLD